MTNYDFYLVTRPLFAKFERENGIPVVRNIQMNVENSKFINFSNLAKADHNSLVLMFHHDKKLNVLWNDPLKFVRKFKDCSAVLTPDFTVQSGMDLELIRMNIYKNRWLGCTWQQYGVKVIPSISWAGPETFDICFSGIETGGIVAISTIGCRGEQEKKVFLEGYKELLKRKNPNLILCYGKPIQGMEGKIVFIDYKDGFGIEDKYSFIPLVEVSKVLDLKGDFYYGW